MTGQEVSTCLVDVNTGTAVDGEPEVRCYRDHPQEYGDADETRAQEQQSPLEHELFL